MLPQRKVLKKSKVQFANVRRRSKHHEYQAHQQHDHYDTQRTEQFPPLKPCATNFHIRRSKTILLQYVHSLPLLDALCAPILPEDHSRRPFPKTVPKHRSQTPFSEKSFCRWTKTQSTHLAGLHLPDGRLDLPNGLELEAGLQGPAALVVPLERRFPFCALRLHIISEPTRRRKHGGDGNNDDGDGENGG